jgi:serpin B
VASVNVEASKLGPPHAVVTRARKSPSAMRWVRPEQAVLAFMGSASPLLIGRAAPRVASRRLPHSVGADQPQRFGGRCDHRAAACSGNTQPAVCGAPQGSPAAVQSLQAANTSFAVAFYEPAVTTAGVGKNAIVSPYSVSTVLTMTSVGAAGETATQMQAVLRLPDTGTNVAPAYAALACQNETDGASNSNQLSIANALWGQQGKTFESAFLSVLSGGYAAPLHQVDFAGNPSGATSTIDDWVSNETQSKIRSLLQAGDVDSSTRLVLVNAVYFKGQWDDGFDPNGTSPRPFTLSDGTIVQVPTMSGAVHFGFGHGGGAGSGFAVYELPYKGRSLVMDFLVPSGSLSDFEASLTPDALSGALASLGSPESENLFLPKFSITTRLSLSPVLAGMGMPDVLDPAKADLSGMDGMRDLYVGTVVQEALVEVDEQGSVANASTAVVVNTPLCSACPGEPLNFAIDSPFLFLVRDTKTGSILFMGRVEDPRALP